jgi:putative redox protein
MSQIAVKWTGLDSRMFVARDSRGATLITGGWYKKGDESWTDWRATKASDLLVVALLSCTGYDVVDILNKQREQLTGLTITADAKQAPEPPWEFTEIHMHYVVCGVDLDPNKVERAIKLSEEKYCSVAATIRGVTKLTYSFELRPAV